MTEAITVSKTKSLSVSALKTTLSLKSAHELEEIPLLEKLQAKGCFSNKFCNIQKSVILLLF